MYIDLFYSPFLLLRGPHFFGTFDAIFTLLYISTWTYGPLFVDYFLREEIFHCSTSVVGHGKRSLGEVSELTLALNQRFLVFFSYPCFFFAFFFFVFCLLNWSLYLYLCSTLSIYLYIHIYILVRWYSY